MTQLILDLIISFLIMISHKSFIILNDRTHFFNFFFLDLNYSLNIEPSGVKSTDLFFITLNKNEDELLFNSILSYSIL